MTILILVSMPPERVAFDRVRGEFDLCGSAWVLADALPEAIVEVVEGRPDEVLSALERHKPAIVFNACEAPLGRPNQEPHVVALLEWLGVPFTGNRSETLTLCRRKDRTKAVLAASGIAVPRPGTFPCIVKPSDEDGSAGISRDSICANATELEKALSHLGDHALVEEFLPGREFTVALWGESRPEYSVVFEWRLKGELRLVTYLAKQRPESLDAAEAEEIPLDADDPHSAALIEVARAAWDAVEGRGYMRVDIRLDGAGQPRVIDVNPNPYLGPPGGMYAAAVRAGWTWERFLRQQLAWAS